jgi:hypothetical protein
MNWSGVPLGNDRPLEMAPGVTNARALFRTTKNIIFRRFSDLSRRKPTDGFSDLLNVFHDEFQTL